MTFGSKSQYSKAAPFTVYDGTTNLGTQSIDESILVTMAQGGRTQGSYDGVGWLELGTYAITGTELKVMLSNLASGSLVDADGVLLVSHARHAFAPSGAAPSKTSDLVLGVLDSSATSAIPPNSKPAQNSARTIVLRGVSAPSPIHVGYSPGSQPVVNQSTPDSIDAILELDLTVCSRIRSW